MNPRNWPPYTCQLRVVSPAEFATVRATPGQAGNLNPGSMFAVMNGGTFVALWGKFANGNQPGDFSLVVPNNLSTPRWVFVSSKADLPPPVAGVITLADEVTYAFTTEVDLLGDRLVAGFHTVIIGASSENCRILSTGLVGSAIITSQWSLPMRNIAIEADIALSLDASSNPGSSLDWVDVTFIDCGTVGSVVGYSSATLSYCSLLNSGTLTFDGSIGAVGINYCTVAPALGKPALSIAATCTVSSRFRVTFSSFIVAATCTGIVVANLASFPVSESFGLDTVSFTGAGTYLSGISQNDTASVFFACVGVQNSAAIASYYVTGNAAATNLAVQGQFYKIAGATLAGPDVSQFTVTNNRATYSGARSAYFRVQAVVSLTDGNNREIAVRVAVNGITVASSESVTDTGSGGRSQTVPVQGIVTLLPGQYVELWAANLSSTGTMTATDFNLIVERIGS